MTQKRTIRANRARLHWLSWTQRVNKTSRARIAIRNFITVTISDQFLHYLRRARISIERITDDTKYSYEVLPTEKDVLNTIITVDLTSKWGFPAPVIWNITAKYSVRI